MEDKIFFSIAKYIPDILRDEKINFGFAYFYPAQKKIGFISSKNTSRILSFDDELDLDTVNMLRSSLEYDFSIDSFEIDDNEELINYHLNQNSDSILYFKIRNYVNQIQFTTPLSISLDSTLEKTLKDLCDIYLYYDRQKKERKMDKDRIRKLSKQIIKSNFSKELYTEYPKDSDQFNTKPFDFKLLTGDKFKYIKALTFDYKKHYRLFEELKIFLYDLQCTLEKDSTLNLEDFIVVINSTDFLSKEELIAKNILEQKINLITIDNLITVLNNDNLLSS